MKNKKEKLVVILLVVGLIVMTGVISFAAFRFTQTGSVLNQITTGSITMSYTESSNVISMTGALPTTDATGKVRLNEGEYFDFTVGSSITGTANINFEIAAQELDGNTIDGSYIKYYLTSVDSVGNETEVMSPKVYKEETESNAFTGRPSNMMSLYEGSMSSSTTTKYRLRLYVDESYNPQGDGGNLIYKVRVNVYGLTGDEIEEELAPGLYDDNNQLILSWEELVDGTYYSLNDGVLSAYAITDDNDIPDSWIDDETTTKEEALSSFITDVGFNPPAILKLANASTIILDDSVTSLQTSGSFYSIKVIMSTSVVSVGEASLENATIYYTGTEKEWNSIQGINICYWTYSPTITYNYVK